MLKCLVRLIFLTFLLDVYFVSDQLFVVQDKYDHIKSPSIALKCPTLFIFFDHALTRKTKLTFQSPQGPFCPN